MPPSWTDILKAIKWQEGRKIELPPYSYRYASTVICTSLGQTEGEFSNGVFRYFTLVAIVRSDGSRIYEGSLTVPVLPDGRLLMVVNQRPGLDFFPNRPHIVEITKGTIDLGLYGSLEFPGGGVDFENIKTGLLRELQEETGIEEQEIVLYRRLQPVYPMVSDVVGRMYFSVVYLSALCFPDRVMSDGGLQVVALTELEIEKNIRRGVIAIGHAALLGWHFYREIADARQNSNVLSQMQHDEYISIEKIKIRG